MKAIIRNYGYRTNPEQRYALRSQCIDTVISRGTSKKPLPPRDIIPQSGVQGFLISWSIGAGFTSDINGWRIYKDDENTLFAAIRDQGTRQYFIPASSGATPPNVNVFVSSINALGVESQKVQVQGKSLPTGSTTVPSSPPGFTSGGSGGGNTGGDRTSKFSQTF